MKTLKNDPGTRLNKFIKDNRQFMSNHITKSFLKQKGNLRKFTNAICFPSEEHENQLNEAFKQFYGEIRLIKYISTLIHYSSVEFNQKMTKYRERHILILDQPISNKADADTTFIDFIPFDISMEFFDDYKTLDEIFENKKIHEALNILTAKQKQVLKLSYINNFSDTEIAKKINVSQQTVSKTRQKALLRIRELLREDDKE